ncbi:hypothetical protein MX850_08940 [Erysipelothrix sp. Poltava]|nr:hypothetical protein MX850_08940 [Erysipelothrix sp. Poltava]
MDAPVITGPSVDAINKEGLTAVDTTDGPYTVDLDQKIKDINLKIAIGYGDTSSSLKNGLIKFDFKNSNYDLVSYSSLAGKPEIKKVTWNAKTDKILTIELKDNIRPDFEINLTVKPKAIVPIGTNLSINYEFSGERLKW